MTEKLEALEDEHQIVLNMHGEYKSKNALLEEALAASRKNCEDLLAQIKDHMRIRNSQSFAAMTPERQLDIVSKNQNNEQVRSNEFYLTELQDTKDDEQYTDTVHPVKSHQIIDVDRHGNTKKS